VRRINAGKVVLQVYGDNELASLAMAEQIIEVFKNKTGMPVYLNLSGGTTIIPVEQLLTTRFKNNIEWHNLHLFWGDEHAGQPNVSRAWEDGKLKQVYDDGLLLPENYHPIQLDKIANLSEGRLVAEYYDTEIGKTVGRSGFDISIIGLGKDYHTMSLLPEKDDFVNLALASKNLVEAINYPSDLYPGIGLRLTMTPFCLRSLSRRNVMFVTGTDKSSALKEVLSGDVDLHRKPGSLIQILQDPVVITDEAAASLF